MGKKRDVKPMSCANCRFFILEDSHGLGVCISTDDAVTRDYVCNTFRSGRGKVYYGDDDGRAE